MTSRLKFSSFSYKKISFLYAMSNEEAFNNFDDEKAESTEEYVCSASKQLDKHAVVSYDKTRYNRLYSNNNIRKLSCSIPIQLDSPHIDLNDRTIKNTAVIRRDPSIESYYKLFYKLIEIAFNLASQNSIYMNSRFNELILLVLDFVETPKDLKIFTRKFCKGFFKISKEITAKLEKLYKIKRGKTKEYLLSIRFILDKEFYKHKELHISMAANTDILHFTLICLVERKSFKKAILLIENITEMRHLFDSSLVDYVSLIKQALCSNTNKTYKIANLNSAISRLSEMCIEKGQYRVIRVLHQYFKGAVPCRCLFAALVKQNCLDEATILYRNPKILQDLSNINILEYHIKTGNFLFVYTFMSKIKKYEECMDYFRLVHELNESRLLIDLMKSVIYRLGPPNGALSLVLLSILQDSHALPTVFLEFTVLLSRSMFSDYQQGWFCSMVYRNLVKFKERPYNRIWYEAARILRRMDPQSHENTYLFLSISKEEFNVNNLIFDDLIECYKEYVEWVNSSTQLIDGKYVTMNDTHLMTLMNVNTMYLMNDTTCLMNDNIMNYKVIKEIIKELIKTINEEPISSINTSYINYYLLHKEENHREKKKDSVKNNIEISLFAQEDLANCCVNDPFITDSSFIDFKSINMILFYENFILIGNNKLAQMVISMLDIYTLSDSLLILIFNACPKLFVLKEILNRRNIGDLFLSCIFTVLIADDPSKLRHFLVHIGLNDLSKFQKALGVVKANMGIIKTECREEDVRYFESIFIKNNY